MKVSVKRSLNEKKLVNKINNLTVWNHIVASFGAWVLFPRGAKPMPEISRAETILLEASCTVGNVRTLKGEIAGALSTGRALALDASIVEQADLTFVQTILAASKSFDATGVPFAVLSPSDAAVAAFARAGASLPFHAAHFFEKGIGDGQYPHRR